MKEYIKEGKMSDYQDHYYPSEMAVDAQIQTFLMKKDSKAFLKKFDTDWVRYIVILSVKWKITRNRIMTKTDKLLIIRKFKELVR